VKRLGSRVGGWFPALLLLLLHPAGAEAHLTFPGVNVFTNGVLHPLVSPAHVLILLGLGLWIGQRMPYRPKLPICVTAAFACIGLALTTTGWIPAVHPAILAGIALGAGAMVAVGRQFSPWILATFCAAGALAIGLDSGAETGAATAVFATLLGTWLAILIVLLNLGHYTALAVEKDKQWLHIGIRVAGSWIVAISLLVLAFALRR
jgi:urease accessory protein